MRRVGAMAAAVVLLALGGCDSGDDEDASAQGAHEDAEDSDSADGESDGDAETSDPESEGDEADDSPAGDEDPASDDDAEPDEDPDEKEEAEDLDPLQGLDLELVADGFDQPLDVATLPGSGDLLVAERTGDLRLVTDGQLADEPFLSLAGTVNSHSIEQGLLGVAPHPDYPGDPRVFVFHSLPSNDNVLVSYRTEADGTRADPDSREVLLTVDKEPDKVRHNGGRLVFGPDGYLYAALGDAARASVNGQDPSTLPGSILRLDVDGGDPYAVPSDNPFADGSDGAPEVWWFGLRNPWRFWIDEPSGLAYVADVGQDSVEEVNVVPFDEGGVNFGWPSFEGTGRFYSDEPASDVTDPVLEVPHGDGEGCSITGGLVYRGSAIPELDGHYLYADWCYGWVRSFRFDDGEAVDVADWTDDLGTEMVAGFGVDADGELLVVDSGAGAVSRIVAVR